MTTRRQFLGHSATAVGITGLLATIEKAAAIAPEANSSFHEAEHVVILMQENRSFDHAFGSMQGVRGFNDPRAMTLANGNPVWVQPDPKGGHFVPFHLDINATNTTWMGSLPHSWDDQVDAANSGRHDGWLKAKRSGHRDYSKMPLTLGYHTRSDLPFYYALADAFTICDQYFCSTLTGTTPNRLHLWTGTIRATPTSPALVRNSECDYGNWQSWTTFPERLEDLGISWQVYQNEISMKSGFTDDEDAWLANFSDNPLEWFTQYGVRYATGYQNYLQKQIESLPKEIAVAEEQLKTAAAADAQKLHKTIEAKSAQLENSKRDRANYSAAAFAKLPARNRALHAKAFSTNAADPAYRSLSTHEYKDGDTMRKMTVPKGDVLHQFRKDVATGKLPAVSWIVPPERYSDHPSSAWYGQWYLSEVIAILTKNPEVWKKTIFILTYDENDGYFDHVPPYQAPHPGKPESGKCSPGIDTAVEHVELADDRRRSARGARGNALGLGFRVPTIIASPWTRGGNVCSQVFDHTSVLQFLEKWLSQKTGKKVEEPNINPWRRTVCGDLTSAFQNNDTMQPGVTQFLSQESELERIHKAQYQKPPANYHAVTEAEAEAIRKNPKHSLMPRQEPGTRRSSPLPYELYCTAALNDQRDSVKVRFGAGNTLFKKRASGAAFLLYANAAKGMLVRHYTVAAGDTVEDTLPLELFTGGRYQIRVHGPNGFYSEFRGSSDDPKLELCVVPEVANSKRTGNSLIEAISREDKKTLPLKVADDTYLAGITKQTVSPGQTVQLALTKPSLGGWYDMMVTVGDAQQYLQRFAGRMETGHWSISDPAMK